MAGRQGSNAKDGYSGFQPVTTPAAPPVMKPLPTRPVPVETPVEDNTELYNSVSAAFQNITAPTTKPELVEAPVEEDPDIARWIHVKDYPAPVEPVKPCVPMSVKNAPPVPEDVQRAIDLWHPSEVEINMKRCFSCGQFKDELHACPRTQDVNRMVQRNRWMKRGAAVVGAATFAAAAMVANGVIPTAIFMTLLIFAAPLVLKNKVRYLPKDENPTMTVKVAFSTLDDRANAIAKAIGMKGKTVRVDYLEEANLSGAQVERDGKNGIVVQVGDRFVNNLSEEDQNGILAHELAHMNKRGLRRLSNYTKAFSAPIGLVAGGVAASAAAGTTVLTLGAPIALGAAVAVLVAGPVYLAGQAAARAEERRADKVAYDLYGEEYINGMEKFMNHYRPGDTLPFALGDIGEPHPSLLNRIRALRGTK